ncbi:MAG: hypothetical protein NC310_07250 [Roseburia sp.]|nr:hypothetical protein [Anaeroplasma bactoclasticum]MCM1196845.1 hypothetical protein [Roseburia sp.]MCM1557043.1 hypothetical protein [Anaeroplasma bactoclasticum]
MKFSIKIKIVIISLMTIIILAHLGIILFGLVPHTLYGTIGKFNFISLVLCLILVVTIFIGLKKKKGKMLYFTILVHILLLFPSFIYGIFLFDSFEKSSTEDIHNYLALDDKKTILDVQSFFPLIVEEEQVEWYRYFYIHSDFPFVDHVTEVSLKIKLDDSEFESVLLDLKEKFPNAIYQEFFYNSKYQEISFADNFDYDYNRRHANVKKILYDEKEKSILYEYIYTVDGLTASDYQDLYYVSKII